MVFSSFWQNHYGAENITSHVDVAMAIGIKRFTDERFRDEVAL